MEVKSGGLSDECESSYEPIFLESEIKFRERYALFVQYLEEWHV